MISLVEAIRRAQANEPSFAASVAARQATALDRSIARAALLPNAVYHNQFLYTQGSGQPIPAGQVAATAATPRFIANNAVHEYVSQGSVTETLGLGQLGELRRAEAAAARSTAELEIARRGLVGTVVGLYYGSLASDRKLAVAERALSEANAFTDLTGKREDAREVAHADVVKAQLQQQQRQRDLLDAQLAAERARLELGVLLFADPRTHYQLEPAGTPAALPDRIAGRASAEAVKNPELRSALAALRESDAGVLSARAAYLPDLTLNYTYGIDAPQFAREGPDHIRNLGYSASVTLDIPIWDWLATEHRVRQSEIRRDAVRVALSAAQRRVIADFEELYSEARAAAEQSASLEASVHTAEESLRLTKLRYTEGEATVLEVVDAQNAFTSAQDSREDGILRYQQAIANLETLTGSL
ncbi:MAG TPA: TolC family protein [Acidisarcina sp.]